MWRRSVFVVMVIKRWKSVTPVSDFSITQKVRTVLIEDGHSDLVVDAITETVQDLEHAHAIALKRIEALETAERLRPKPISDTGMHAIVKKTFLNMLWSWTKPLRLAFVGAIGTASLGGMVWIGRLIWRGLHT